MKLLAGTHVLGIVKQSKLKCCKFVQINEFQILIHFRDSLDRQKYVAVNSCKKLSE